MAKIYLKLILAGRKTFGDVPSNYSAAVQNLLVEKAENGDSVAKKILKEMMKDG